MKINEKIVNEYITTDGKVFESGEKAMQHEYKVIADGLFKNMKTIDQYELITLKNSTDLQALLFNVDKYDGVILIKGINEFPCVICRTLSGIGNYTYEPITSAARDLNCLAKQLLKYNDEVLKK